MVMHFEMDIAQVPMQIVLTSCILYFVPLRTLSFFFTPSSIECSHVVMYQNLIVCKGNSIFLRRGKDGFHTNKHPRKKGSVIVEAENLGSHSFLVILHDQEED